jgi:hypothetical protein
MDEANTPDAREPTIDLTDRPALDAAAVSIVPRRTSDAATAYYEYRRRGAVVVTTDPPASPPAGADADLLQTLFGNRLHHVGDAVEVRAAGGRDRPDLDADGHTLRSFLHSDGYSLAEGAPDVLLLTCERASAIGGESFMVDIDLVVAGLRGGSVDDRALATLLVDRDVDQTDLSRPDLAVAPAPVGRRRVDGTVAWRRSPDVRPLPDDPDAGSTARLLARWTALLDHLEEAALRFRLEPGDVLVSDNTRTFHGRDPYEDRDRLLWRRWAWTDRAVEPDTAYPVSDISLVAG